MRDYPNPPDLSGLKSNVDFDRPEQFNPNSPYRVFLAMHPMEEKTETPEQQAFHKQMSVEFQPKLRANNAALDELLPLHSSYVNGEGLTSEQEKRLTEIVESLK